MPNIPIIKMYKELGGYLVTLGSASGEIPVIITEQTSSHIVLEASAYAHSVALDGDYVFFDNFFIMLPREKRTVIFQKTYNARSDIITLNVL